MNRTKILAGAAFVLAALLIAKHIVIDRSPVPAKSDYGLDIEKMRSMARAGALPVDLRVEIIGESNFPASAVVAGEGLTKKIPMVFSAYQAVFPDGKSIIIDTALGAEEMKKMSKDGVFHADRFDRMQRAMQKADKIILTHEHVDHIGGVAAAPDLRSLQPRLALSKEQIHDKYRPAGLFTPEGQQILESSKPLEDELYQTIAPGIVALKSPSHSPGTQFIYLALKDGREFLFVGDIAWSMENVRKLTGKPVLMNMMFLKENRELVASQLRALHDLIQNPANTVRLIVAHDAVQLAEYLQAGTVQEGFK